MSDSPGMRWDIDTTKRVIGYAPQDGVAPVVTDALVQKERDAKALRARIAQLDAEWMQLWH